LLLLNPGINISTKEAYKNCKPHKPESSLEELIRLPVDKWRDMIINDFEEYAFKKYPMINYLKNELYRIGATFSSMSGSGSSVYGIFRTKPEIPLRLNQNLIYSGIL
jgi:4-diphosphocytidyl-2-C-methyl-D-erythritol kinase